MSGFCSRLRLRENFQLQIKVSGQRGSLGLSIAGGKGSLPYKNRDEVGAGQPASHLSARPHRDERRQP